LEKTLRNIFDQYSQPENRITHALLTAINEDQKLLMKFLRLINVTPPKNPTKLTVLEQQYPWEQEASEEESEKRGIPDGWIFNEDGWCVFIETKVLAKLDTDQLNRHRRTAEKRLGFRDITAVVITPKPLPQHSLPSGTVLLEWRNIYAWLRQNSSDSLWADRAAKYLEIAEAKMIGTKQFMEGALTMFSGFHFGNDNPFTYTDGKRTLTLAMHKLRNRTDLVTSLGMNPKTSGRGAITGRQGNAVWDFLSIGTTAGNDLFTKHPHLTLAVGVESVEAMVTVPNAVNSTMRRNLVEMGEANFQTLVGQILNNLKPLLREENGASPWFRGIQRRYPSQRATPLIDAKIEFDLRTAVSSGGPPKNQPRWLSAAYGSFVNKQGSNYQIQVGVVFRYERCKKLRNEDAIDLLAGAWLACKPLVDLAR
jgi:hypothetical protein